MKSSDLQRIYGDLAAPSYSTNWKSNRVQKVLRLIGVRTQPLRILDVGCADGILAPITTTHQIFGVDINEQLLKKAKANGYSDCRVADLDEQEIPYGENFDMVVCGECIEHLSDTDWLLHNINQRLRLDGELILTFPNLRTPIGLLMMLVNRVPMFGAGYRSGHVKDFTTRSIRDALANNGFQLVKMEGVDFCVSSSPFGILPGVATFLPGWASTVIVYARKCHSSKYATKVNI